MTGLQAQGIAAPHILCSLRTAQLVEDLSQARPCSGGANLTDIASITDSHVPGNAALPKPRAQQKAPAAINAKRPALFRPGRQTDSSSKLLRESDINGISDKDSEQPPEAGIVSEATVSHVKAPKGSSSSSTASSSPPQSSAAYASPRTVLFPAKEQGNIKDSWQTLMRWSKVFKKDQNGVHVLDKTEKVVVFGGGSFGTAMGVALARQRSTLNVALLLRDAYNCRDINSTHTNTRYLPVSVLHWGCEPIRIAFHQLSAALCLSCSMVCPLSTHLCQFLCRIA